MEILQTLLENKYLLVAALVLLFIFLIKGMKLILKLILIALLLAGVYVGYLYL